MANEDGGTDGIDANGNPYPSGSEGLDGTIGVSADSTIEPEGERDAHQAAADEE